MNFAEIPWIADHTKLYRSDPEKAHMWDSSPLGGPGMLPTLLLTTTGRKSGEKRDSPLIYGEDNGKYIVIGSKGGWATHPHWYLNLEADPECELIIASKECKATARVAEGDERERYWKKLAEMYPPYDEYQKGAGDRLIPVVVLEPHG